MTALRIGNFRQIARHGFGDPNNCYPHSMAWFNEHLYVGTTRNNLDVIWASRKKTGTPVSRNIVWPVKLVDDIFQLDLRAQIWRYNPRTESWEKVYTAPWAKGTDGSDVPTSFGFRAMIPFKGASDAAPALYVPTWATSKRPAMELLRSENGVDFEVVSEPGLGIKDQTIRGLRALVPFKQRLFTAPVSGVRGAVPAQMLVLVSTDPARRGWQIACKPGFGDPNNVAVAQMAVFQNCLYAGTYNIAEGYQIWKTAAEGQPPYRWEKVISHGAYRGKLNQIAGTFETFGEHLYIGSAINYGGFDVENKVGPAPPELIRISSDDSWELLVGSTRDTPDGLKVPLSGFGPGFNNFSCCYFWSMSAHEGWLYLGTAVWSPFLFFVLKDRVPEVLLDLVEPAQLENTMLNYGGFDLWYSRDGVDWLPVTMNGFGNPFNLGARNMVSTPFGLFVGCANLFGPESAKKSQAGWRYEYNPNCGLEVWLGSHNHFASKTHGSNPELPMIDKRTSGRIRRLNKSRAEFHNDLLKEFLNQRDYCSLGYWCPDTKDLKSACENLIDEALAFLPDKVDSLLEVGCSKGTIAKYLLKRFRPEILTAVTTDKKSLNECKLNAPEVQFIYMKLPSLFFPGQTFQSIISIEGLARTHNKFKLFQNLFRLIKPGGHLVFTDIIYEKQKLHIGKNFRKRSIVPDSDGYRTLLQHVGFKEVRTFDITHESWFGFQKHLAQFLESKQLSGEIDADEIYDVKKLFLSDIGSVAYYVLASAKKEQEG